MICGLTGKDIQASIQGDTECLDDDAVSCTILAVLEQICSYIPMVSLIPIKVAEG